MAMAPDDKDWTWVLERPCPECGFDAALVSDQEISPGIRANAAHWQRILSDPEATLRTRPRPDRWSPLEYACHVRDVFVLFDQRLQLMLNTDTPSFANWDQDATAVEQRYGDQDPAAVTPELEEAARRLADRFAGVTDDQWSRRGLRSDGAEFTVASFGRYLLHDPVHHIFDVTGQPAT
jgi:hypothetical protein